MLKFAAFFYCVLLMFSAAVAEPVRSASAISGTTPGAISNSTSGSTAEANAKPGAAEEADRLVARALEKHLDENLQWRRLIHYRKTWFGLKSEADNPRFFVDQNGRQDPRAELAATIRQGVMNSLLPVAMPGADAMTVRCQYPARWKWLMKSLDVSADRYPIELAETGPCRRYTEFLTHQKPASVTFVFSGFYVDNPSSSFGHVLLRLNRADHAAHAGGDRRPESKGAELLDHGVGYAANATSSNPLIYAIGGFAGWFPSTFSSLPFYYKVREYSDAESRDLWEYDLNLTPEEVERVADHLWELGSTYFDYYYLKQNCAYHLLALLEAAAPRLNLLGRVPFYIIPVDTVKTINEEPGLVGRVVYRPSTARILRERLVRLTAEETDLFYRVRTKPKPADDVIQQLGEKDPSSAARVLDAVLDEIDYRHFRELVFKTNPEVAARKQNVLLARAQLPMTPEIQVPVTLQDRPDRSHGSFRYWLGVGTQTNLAGDSLAAPDRGTSESRTVIDGEVRFAIHSIHDPLDGYLPSSSVEFWRMRGRFDAKSARAELESFSLFTISSLSPLSRLDKKPAWRVNIGLDRVRDHRCDGCLAPTAQGSIGGSIEPRSGVLLYALAGPRGETSTGFTREKWIASGGGLLGARLKFSHEWQLDFEAEWRRVFDRETFDRTSGEVRLRWDHATNSTQSPIAIELVGEAEPLTQTGLLRFVSYF